MTQQNSSSSSSSVKEIGSGSAPRRLFYIPAPASFSFKDDPEEGMWNKKRLSEVGRINPREIGGEARWGWNPRQWDSLDMTAERNRVVENPLKLGRKGQMSKHEV